MRLRFTIDTSQITGAVGSQSTPGVNGTLTLTDITPATHALTGTVRVVVNGSSLSFFQEGSSTIVVNNTALASTDLKGSFVNVPGSAASGALSFATAGGVLSVAAGARFSFHTVGTLWVPGQTFSITEVTRYNVTNASNDVETFLTRVAGRFNNTSVYDQSLNAAFSDAAVQAAVNQARAAISSAAGGNAVTITGPTRTANSRTLTNSSQQTVDGAAIEVISVTNTLGPAYIYAGSGESTQLLVTAGFTNTDVLTTRSIPRTVTTTNTYRNSETYTLDGSLQAAPTGLRFKSLDPCRLMETRPEYNFQNRVLPFGPPFLNASETRTFVPPLSTVCTVPSTAKAYVLNVTVIPRGTGVDHVTVYPAGELKPDFWTVRSPDGLIVANSAIVKAGAGGGISVFASHATDLIIDIAGYFTDNPQESNLVYYPLTPCRVIETRQVYRPTVGPFGPPTLAAKQARNFRFPLSPDCQIPSGAAAYSVTLTVVPPAPLPFLTAWPAGASQPNVSSINSPNGRVLANSIIVPASSEGSISLYPFETTDAIVDINGYFAPDNGTTGLFYFPLTQCRVSNSNDGTYTGNFGPPIYNDTTTRTIPIATSPRCSGSPANAKAYALNATVIPNGSPMPFLTIFPTGQPQPNASVINAFEGQTVSSGFIVPAGTNGSIDVYAFRRTHVVIEIAGYFGR